MAAALQIREASISLRSATVEDEKFLLDLYAQSRAEELARSGMDPLQREVFVQMQFQIRRAAYSATYPMARNEIICGDKGAALGRVITDRTAKELCLVDLAITTEMQGQGIGTKVIQELQHECLTHGWKMRLQVLKGSSAERLYKRLGFSIKSEDSLRRQMVWDGTKI